MDSMKEVYYKYYFRLIRVLPMNEHFIEQLHTSQFLCGDAKDRIMKRVTRDEKASFFLDYYVTRGFIGDHNNPLFENLLWLMERSDDMVLKSLAEEIANKLSIIVSDKPTPSTLNDHVIPLVAPNWYALGKQLLGDKHIQKLDQIQNDCRENTVKGCTEMFNTWLKADQNVSWEKLIKELKASQLPDEVSQLSDKIKEMTVKGGVGSDRPALRDLYEHVVEEAAYKWRDLRVDLLPYERHAVLDIIEADGPNDVECCINVFERWLETTRDATWYQLIRALSSPNVRLNDLAFHLEQMIVREVTSKDATAIASNATTQYEIFSQKPEMFHITKIVIPKIMNQWEYIAEALHYDLYVIEAIKVKEGRDPKRCCREFFKDWLMTNNGVKAGPKMWSTLLDALKGVDEIATDVTEDIIAKVKQLK